MTASTKIHTAWVKPPNETGGLDHLGVKAPVIHIYGELLPGITNVTDRARYYSFYPWLVWRLDKAGIRDWQGDARQYVRRADCLFTLIANYHEITHDKDGETHALGLVGNLTLAKVARQVHAGEAVDLDRYATEEEGGERYFKNKLGGLGQYYIGSLRDVLLLGGDATSGLRYTTERGTPMAEAFSQHVDADRFWRCIQTASVNKRDLDALKSFCPCHLASSTEERQQLLDVLFARDEFAIDAGHVRQASLNMLLHLTRQLEGTNEPFDVSTFRGCVYGSSLPNGAIWIVPSEIELARSRWATYVTNEVMSIGLQGLFYSALEWLQQYEPAPDAKEMAAWFIEDKPGKMALKELPGDTVAELLSVVEDELPSVDDWTNPAHEYALAQAVVTSSDVDAKALGKMTANAARALASLLIRLRDSEAPYQHLTFPPGYFEAYPLNLQAFRKALPRWRSMSLSAWLQELIADWCINAHIRVALRKLRNQSQATFQVQPTDRGFLIIGTPVPEFSNPRFKQARQMLIDTGCIETNGDGLFSLTNLGAELLGND